MIATLKRRVDQLETGVKPADEPEEFVIEFVGPEKEVVRTLSIQGSARVAIQDRAMVRNKRRPQLGLSASRAGSPGA
jgi:hypothetical protein